VALDQPEAQGGPITHWTARELGDKVRERGIAPGISNRQVKRFLDKADLKPHRMLYWLNPKIDDFDGKVFVQCSLEAFFDTCTVNMDRKQFMTQFSKDGRLISRWIMPFQKQALITITNTHPKMGVSVQVDTESIDWEWDSRSMYFNGGRSLKQKITTEKYVVMNDIYGLGGVASGKSDVSFRYALPLQELAK